MVTEHKDEDRTVEYTDLQLQFLKLLQKYPVKNPETVVDYVTTQGETVLEDPEKLARSLGECEISPVRRRQILKHWFAEKGVDVAEDLLQKVGLPPDRRKEVEEKEEAERESKKSKYSVDQETGVIKVATTSEKPLTWEEAEKVSKHIKKEIAELGKGKAVTYVYDSEASVVRMAKEGEQGGTLDQAKELKKMADEGKEKGAEESPFIQGEDGNLTVNPKAKITGVELLAWNAIQRAQEKGEAVDPLEAIAQAAEKMKIYQEALGGGARALPEWMSDPAKFIETVERIAGGGKGDEGLKTEVAGLKKTLDDMREDKYKEQIGSQQAQIKGLTDKVGELTDVVVDLKKTPVGRTEMDIIHDVATGGLDFLKTELPGMRRDIKEAIGSTALPPAKTPEQREDRKGRLREAVKRDQDIEQIGRRLFFREG